MSIIGIVCTIVAIICAGFGISAIREGGRSTGGYGDMFAGLIAVGIGVPCMVAALGFSIAAFFAFTSGADLHLPSINVTW